MSGIYIHIPFCRKKCNYCDFYKTTETGLIPKFIESLSKEIELRSDYLGGETVETIYFGGGTPSVLEAGQIGVILNFIYNRFKVIQKPEITLEANPDDLSVTHLKKLICTGINRLSLGIQSFDDGLLKLMNRRHNAVQSTESVIHAEKAGFSNISIDLIYGLPGLSTNDWGKALDKMSSLPVNHISAYHLTYHGGTLFYRWLKSKKISETTEEESISQFKLLIDKCSEMGFEQYEISNFARDGAYSKHNSSYWSGKKYLGLGPSAHSYNILSRQKNISTVEKYINSVEKGELFFKTEKLNANSKYNEFILTRLRTKWGISVDELKRRLGEKYFLHFVRKAEKFIVSGNLILNNGVYTFSLQGQFISDNVITDLMIV